MKLKLILTAAIVVTCNTSCTMTGDPNAGGYWNWSRGMAQKRVDNLQGELDIHRKKSNRLASDKSSLESQKKRLEADIAELDQEIKTLRKRLSRAQDPALRQNILISIKDKESRRKALERKYQKLLIVY